MSRNSQKIRNHIFRNRYRQKSCSSLRSGDTRSHFLIQSVPNYSPTEIVTIIKSLTAKHIFLTRPEVKKQLWGGEFWSDGFFVNTVSKFGGEKTISTYVRNQGKDNEYTKLHKQLVSQELF